ncbi:glyoxalase [Peribacillus cavernae]|uniref:Glyoxalase n=1 Tax=Peribacillus cavernae TaxID=1674310 RepID=A0A3S0VPW7_9BACI|nr:VOC family protein [Peribacillus cavernae]MDQ0217452.1 catechol 2,3-dioxygenase-like lactoylglutathione lyase family enzyme [Peribacillus cavernae]RUQ30104.1 glyoxalase [Peribacillus cavernae]
MFKNGNVTVMVRDVNKAVQFYVETLGLKLEYQVDGHWAQVQAPGLTLGLHPIGENGSQLEKSDNLSIGFEPENFDTSLETLRARGVVFAPIMEDKATRIAPFYDLDGNSLYLVQVKPESGAPNM